MKRGDIYYIEINDEGVTGHEMMKSRPGIIVSRDDHNEAAETVQVVYCSASQHRELPEHVGIRSTPRPSTAMCEHIYTVDKSRLGNFVGHLTHQELQWLDIGIMVALGIGGTEPENLRGGVLLPSHRRRRSWSASAASWRPSEPCTSGCLTE